MFVISPHRWTEHVVEVQPAWTVDDVIQIVRMQSAGETETESSTVTTMLVHTDFV